MSAHCNLHIHVVFCLEIHAACRHSQVKLAPVCDWLIKIKEGQNLPTPTLPPVGYIYRD